MPVVSKTLAYAIFGGFIIAGLALLQFLMEPQQTELKVLIFSISQYATLALISLFFLSLFLGVLWALFRAVWRLTLWIGQATTTNNAERWHKLVALALVFALFPSLAQQIFRTLNIVGYRLVTDLPERVFRSITDSSVCVARNVGLRKFELQRAEWSESRDAISSSEATGMLFDSAITQPLGSRSRAFGTGLECWSNAALRQLDAYTGWFGDIWRDSGLPDFNFGNVLAATAIFVVVSLLLSWLFTSGRGPARFWFGFTSVAVAGVYLALSAILAVPLIQKEDKDTEKAGPLLDLRTHLEGISDPKKEYEATEAPPSLVTVSLSEYFAELQVPEKEQDGSMLDQRILPRPPELPRPKPEEGLSEKEKPDVSNVELNRLREFEKGIEREFRAVPYSRRGTSFRDAVREITVVIANMERDYTENDRKAKQLAKRFRDDSSVRVTAAETLFKEESLNRLGEREARRHYFTIVQWFQSITLRESETYLACRDALFTLRLDHKHAVSILGAIPKKRGESETYSTAIEQIQSRYKSIQNKLSSCADRPTGETQPPPRPAYGSFLGPVGSSTGWLLNTESIEVVLIVGLTGFGLLGALVSQFSRHARDNRHQEEATGELAIVIFTGFVAALVVYVAAYGGIALYPQATGTPNAYVVFAACLVGAIYSEDIFQTVYSKLIGGNSGDTDTKNPDETKPG